MSVAVLKLEDETLVAFNLTLISLMMLEPEGLWFKHDGQVYASYHVEGSRRLYLHPSVCGKDDVMLHSAEAMFDKFCNL